MIPIFSADCPVTATMQMLSKRWTFFIIRAIRHDIRTFNAIKRSLGGRISNRTLSDRLQELEAGGLIQRTVVSKNPLKTEYIFTRKGASIQPIIDTTCTWAHDWK